MNENIEKAREAIDKLQQLLNCGNERVEFSAAKEILSFLDKQNSLSENTETDGELNITIQVIQ